MAVNIPMNELRSGSYFGQSIKEIKWRPTGETIWTAGANVTYNVDKGVSYIEDVSTGASVLSPKTFTPSKSGWTFLGWREDTIASSSVLSSKVMGSDPITLFAVYKKTITETFIDWDGSKSNQYPVQSTAYYNAAGNAAYSNITAPNAAEWSGWTLNGWSYPNNGDIVRNVLPGDIWTSTDDCVRYAIYEQPITLSYHGNGATGGSVSAQTSTRYCNVSGNWYNPTFTLKANGFSRSDYEFTGWDLGAPGATITLDSHRTAYAQWTQIPAEPFTLTTDIATFSNDIRYGNAIGNTWPSSDNPYWYLSVDHDDSYGEWAYGISTASAVGRKHCTKCKFTCFTGGDSGATLIINDNAHSITSGENVIDISGYSDSLVVQLHTDSSASNASVHITAPYFY